MALVRETNIHGWNNEGQEFHLHSLKHCPKLIRMTKNKHWTSRFFEMWYIAETQNGIHMWPQALIIQLKIIMVDNIDEVIL